MSRPPAGRVPDCAFYVSDGRGFDLVQERPGKTEAVIRAKRADKGSRLIAGYWHEYRLKRLPMHRNGILARGLVGQRPKCKKPPNFRPHPRAIVAYCRFYAASGMDRAVAPLEINRGEEGEPRLEIAWPIR